ncbi:MAG TPA: cysteine desulfurase-like protein [Steroidobacteraceae bacterium]|jgi:cysteine desulfurase family protein, VC1184 subfamily|nr:cysteine desulfurase-like protein [Steroidobacteraceae bacterium]
MSIVNGQRFPVERLRAEFPALQRAGAGVFFDNAAGAQVPQAVFDAINEHLLERNVQRGGRYPQSVAVDETIARARASVAAFVNAREPNEIAFGLNATSFIRLVSLAVGQTLGARNEIIVTDLDHEANVATWLALAPLGAEFRWWRMRDDGTLHLEDLAPLLSPRTRLLACAVASNALGTIVDVRGAADLVHAAGGEIFLDCVHFAPHGRVDVQAFDCDYLVCSGYKIFGPHMGFLWGRYELLERLPTFREDFIPDAPPGKIEAGTVSYESVAGMDAAVRYLARLGRSLASGDGDLRADIARAMQAILGYERGLTLEMLKVLHESNARVHGIADPSQIARRVPTLAFNLEGIEPAAVTEAMARAQIGIRDGHMYSPRLMRRLGLPEASGTVRVSLVHYNTVAEIQRFGDVLSALIRD